MIEAIARAAWDSQRENGYDVFERWDKLSDKGRQVVIDRVRAVLKALESPAPAMIEAGRAAFYNLTGDGKYEPDEVSLKRAFTAMIKAAQEQGDG